jgi:hypothetical protein
MKRFPTYRIDVYKTHRTVAYPDIVIKNTSKAAVKAKTTNGGLTVKDAHAAIPFPIPKDGYEAMWNHMLRYMGRADDLKWESITVDSSGKVLVTLAATVHEEYPYYDEDPARPDADLCWRAMWFVHGPIRRVGEAGMIDDSINPYNKPRVAYQYLPGQRRIKLAPEIGFDTPSFTTSGAATYDQVKMYNGSMERYNMKLIGKREIYVPYNTYRAFCQVKREELYGPKHLNPDHVRWELHRVWVVEGNLKPGMRHIYYKRTFYLEEDSWSLSAIENYDKIGNLFTVDFGHQTPLYDVPAPFSNFAISYNLISNCYSGDYWLGPDGFIRRSEVWPLRQWSPSRLAGAGVR